MTSSYQKDISTSSLSSADVIGSNDDIIMEILLRLPVKSLLKFKLVSRRWLSLISDLNFVVRHCRLSAKAVSHFILGFVLHFKFTPAYMYVSLDENNENHTKNYFSSFDPSVPGPTMISLSCNGLLLCYSRKLYGSIDPLYYVFNPATNKFSTLPKPVCNEDSTKFFSLAYDPIISPFYQVVCFQFFTSSCKIQIYSSETKLWRNAKDQEFDSFTVAFRHNGVYWNGGIHWINTYEGNLWRFDIEQERVQSMPRPPLHDGWNSKKFRHFMESQGHLFLIGFDFPEYIIYEMEKDCSKWFLKHRLDINLIVSVFPDQMIKNKESYSSDSLLELEDFISPISVVEVKNEGPSLVMHIPGRFISYRFNDDTFKTIREVMFHHSDYTKRFSLYHTFSYIESLSFV